MQDDGREGVTFRDAGGQRRLLTVPASLHHSPDYRQDPIEHIRIAVHKGVWGTSTEQEEGAAYVQDEARRQIDAGACFLDLNVDAISDSLDARHAAMRWLVETVQEVSTIPLSIDSSQTSVIQEGVQAYLRRQGRPLVNSATLERIAVLSLAREFDTEVVVTAWGHGVMPRDDKERVANIKALLSHADGIPLERIHVDPLILPICSNTRSGQHYLDAVRTIRAIYGPAIHITGGMSNVSFGLPNRRLINETFIMLAIEAGIDSAIMNPIQCNLAHILARDPAAEPTRLARTMLLDEDNGCSAYQEAWKAGRLRLG